MRHSASRAQTDQPDHAIYADARGWRTCQGCLCNYSRVAGEPGLVDAEAKRWRQLVKTARVAAIAVVTMVVCVMLLYGSAAVISDDGNRPLIYVYAPPIVVTAGSFVAMIFGRKRRLVYGSILLGTALFWVGWWILFLVAMSQLY